MQRFFDTSNLRGDIYGGITAGVVALPLALAFGEASGVGPIAGLWGAILVGFFAALFGGTGAQISGPTGPMIVVFAGLFDTLDGEIGLIFTAVVLAGLIQIVFGVLKFGQYIRLVPYPVVSGFMSGIGAIIIALQVSRLFGHEPSGSGTIPALEAIPGAVSDANLSALAVGAVCLILIFTWPKSLGKYVPSPLAALFVGTFLSIALGGGNAMPILGDIPVGLPSFILPEFTQQSVSIVLEAAIVLALLGAIDSLLTSLVADNMTRTRHNSDQELVGQGVGNMVAGLFGAIPGAGATMRTVVNIRTGGGTKISGMLHSVLLFMVVIVLAPFASQIPHAALAGILIKVGYDILDLSYLRNAHRGPRWDLVLMALVLGLTVFVDLITAVLAGVVLAALAFVKKIADDQLQSLQIAEPFAPTEDEQRILDEYRNSITVFEFGGPLSFGAAADVGHTVRERVREGTAAIILDFHRVPFIDVSAARAVETITTDAVQMNKTVYTCGINDHVAADLEGLDADHSIDDRHRFTHRIEAIKAAATALDPSDRDTTAHRLASSA